MRNTLIVLMAGLISAFALPAFAASAVQVWECQLLDGKTNADVMALSKQWLAAAKSMKGGEEVEVYVGLPIAGSGAEGSFNFIMIAKDLATWGVFWNGYSGSAAAKADASWEGVATCGVSSLETSIKIE
jgi:hypothetical protein